MNVLEKERHIKLHMLISLARSQRALSQMLESVAQISADSEKTAKKLAENIEVIGKHQRVLAEKITGVKFARMQRGSPGKIWLNSSFLQPIAAKETSRDGNDGNEGERSER